MYVMYLLSGFKQQLTMQNTGHQSLSLHMRAPKSRSISFSCGTRVFRLAPGMHVDIDIAYRGVSEQTARVKEELVLKYEGGCLKIPIIYKSMCARFELRGEFDCGMVCAGTDVVKHLSVVNCGACTGMWSLRTESDCKMEAEPSEGELGPGASTMLTLVMPEIDPGDWVGHLQLISAEDATSSCHYNVNVQAVIATVELQGELGQPIHEVRSCGSVLVDLTLIVLVHHTLLVLVHLDCSEWPSVDLLPPTFKRVDTRNLKSMPDHPVGLWMQMDFGASLSNDVHKKAVLIMNGSPVPVKYAIEVNSATSNCGQSTESDRDAAELQNRVSSFIEAARTRAQMRGRRDVAFQITPSHGEVAPFQKALLTVTYKPKIEDPQSGFVSTVECGSVIHSFMGKVELQGASKRICQLPLKGRCEFQVASISPQQLHFNGPMSASLSFMIHNNAKDTVIRYRVQKTPAFFKIDGPQMKALVHPQAAATVTVMYRPKALGLHSGNCVVAILAQNGTVVEEHTIAVTGACGSIAAGQLDLSMAMSRNITKRDKRQILSSEVNDTVNLGLDTWKGFGTGDPGKPKHESKSLRTFIQNASEIFTAFPGLAGAKAPVRPFKVLGVPMAS